MTTVDVLVLSEGVHGLSPKEYAQELHDRLPDHNIVQARTPFEERAYINEAPIVTGLTLDKSLLENAEELSMFCCVYAGTDHLPMEEFNEREITVTNAAGVHGPNVAEFVIGSMIAFTHRFSTGMANQSRHEWRHYQTPEIYGDTITIFGLGSIGEAIANRLEGFGVETIGIRKSPDKGGPTDDVLGCDDTKAVANALAETDHLILAIPLSDETRGMIGKTQFKILPPSAIIINIARGPIVDTPALLWALQEEQIAGAILDVTDPEPLPEEHPLWNFDNVRITPHNAGATPAYYERVADIVADNVRRFDRREQLRNVVIR